MPQNSVILTLFRGILVLPRVYMSGFWSWPGEPGIRVWQHEPGMRHRPGEPGMKTGTQRRISAGESYGSGQTGM